MKQLLIYLYSTLLTALIITGCQSSSHTRYAPDTEERIKQVENSLGDWVQTQYDTTWNLWERMKHHNITGVSIAVVHDFKLRNNAQEPLN
ncbi:MAG: hypothetical protein GX622_02430 [Bacteroidales bacterium]|nr:hypothetical protein [Bacteroidales bacterium]